MKLDVIKLAEQADIRVLIEAEDGLPALFTSVCTPDLERFAALVIEECAKECDAIETNEWQSYKKTYDKHVEGMSDGATECAAAIRAMKEPE